jgi:hypothetical protein
LTEKRAISQLPAVCFFNFFGKSWSHTATFVPKRLPHEKKTGRAVHTVIYQELLMPDR